MFDHTDDAIGLWPGESHHGLEAAEQLAYEVTCRELVDGWVEPERHLLPDDLESMPSGLFLAAIFGSVNRLNGHDLVRLLQAEARLEGSAAAQKIASVAEVALCPPGDASSPVERNPEEVEYAAVEIAAALTLTRRAAETLLERALWLSRGGWRVWEAVHRGDMDVAKATEYQRHLSHLDAETVGSVLDATLDVAGELTTGQLRHRIQRQVMTVDPDGSRSSTQEGLQERKVVTHANPDFTGCFHICSTHPTELGKALRHVDRLARAFNDAGDERTLDQLRADIALDLLQGRSLDRAPEHGGAIHLTVPLETLAGLVDIPGEMDGYGPVIADIARQVSLEQVDGQWTWTVTDEGDVLATGTTRYRPTAAQTRKARADYPTCVAPGCRMPVYNCDLDHRHPYSRGGRTHNANLAPLCRHHHMMRHHSQWRYERLPDGSHRWTSPLGHTYIRKRDPPD
jgi:hypothetical protein